jgi:protein-arginine kinase activator protein McsA
VKIIQQQTIPALSAIDLVQKEMEKASSIKTAVAKESTNEAHSPSSKKKSLEKEMQEAISKEDYEKAAEIRDKINSLNK